MLGLGMVSLCILFLYTPGGIYCHMLYGLGCGPAPAGVSA